MDATNCTEPYFQWDDETHSCLGCIEEGALHENCKVCDDLKENYEIFYRCCIEPPQSKVGNILITGVGKCSNLSLYLNDKIKEELINKGITNVIFTDDSTESLKDAKCMSDDHTYIIIANTEQCMSNDINKLINNLGASIEYKRLPDLDNGPTYYEKRNPMLNNNPYLTMKANGRYKDGFYHKKKKKR